MFTTIQTQELAFDWGTRCFGEDHMNNLPVRCLRMVEEAVEAAQAVGVPKDMLHKLVDMVYDRPSGELSQELGGVLITVGVLALLKRWSLDELMYQELRTCLSRPPTEFAKRNEEKLRLGLTG